MGMIAEFSAQGHVAQVRRVPLVSRPRQGGGIRGVVSSFTRASRRRLINLMARLDVRRTRVTFITMTFADAHEPDEATAAFRRFIARMRRWFPEASAVWRRERQERGAFHYHMLWFNLPFIPQYWLQDTWTECTREALSILDVRLVRSHKQAMAYVSKYIAKVDTPPVPPSLENPTYLHVSAEHSEGRMWGAINRDALPWGVLVEVLTTDEEMTDYFFAAVRKLSHGRSGGSDEKAALYCDDAYEMIAWAVDHMHRAGVDVQRELVAAMRFKAVNSGANAHPTRVNR